MPFSLKRKDPEQRKNEEQEKAELALSRDNELLDKAEAKEADAVFMSDVPTEPSEDELPVSFKEAFLEGFVFKNPSLVDFVGLTPIIIGGTSVKNGLVLSAATVAVLLIVCLFASLTRNIISRKFAPAAYTVVASVSLVPLTWLGYTLFPSTMFSLGIVFPLIAVNGINLSRARGFASKHDIKISVADALGKGLGFSAVLILVSVIREVLGYGTFFDISLPVFEHFHSSIICGIPGGFISMAVFAAVVQYIAQKRFSDGGEPS